LEWRRATSSQAVFYFVYDPKTVRGTAAKNKDVSCKALVSIMLALKADTMCMIFSSPLLRCAALRRCSESGFSLAEVLVTVGICIFFGLATFQTNQRLLNSLKGQKETTAAIMVLQERKETLRSMPFTDIATADTLKNKIQIPTGSEAALGNLTETVTVSVDPNDAAYTSPSPTPTVLQRDAQNQNGRKVIENANLASYDLLRVDILLTWTSANGRQRSRQSSELFGHGNIGDRKSVV